MILDRFMKCLKRKTLVNKEFYDMMEMGNEEISRQKDFFVNFATYSSMKRTDNNLPLFTASKRKMKWREGLSDIVKGYPKAIEDVDWISGLEAFMLAALGVQSDLETIYQLLLYHPSAINLYASTSETKKRKRN